MEWMSTGFNRGDVINLIKPIQDHIDLEPEKMFTALEEIYDYWFSSSFRNHTSIANCKHTIYQLRSQIPIPDDDIGIRRYFGLYGTFWNI